MRVAKAVEQNWLGQTIAERLVELAAISDATPVAERRRPRRHGFRRIIPFAMLFVRCRGRFSHNPAEFASPADIDIAARVLATFLHRMSSP